MSRGTQLAILAALVVGAGPTAAAGAPRPYTFAVVPQSPPEQLRAVWLPLVERLAADANTPLELRLYGDVEDFQADLAAGAVDLAFANPVQVVRAFEVTRYRPLVRNERPLKGVLFVSGDSPITSAEALAGREVAFVGPWTLCSVSLRVNTRPLHVRPRYVGTAANAYKNVLLGMVAAGGVLDASLADAPPEIRSKLKVIYETPAMAPHAVIAHPRVPAAVARRLVAAFLALRTSGPELLRPVHLDAPVEASFPRDYAPLSYLLGEDPPQGPPRRAAP